DSRGRQSHERHGQGQLEAEALQAPARQTSHLDSRSSHGTLASSSGRLRSCQSCFLIYIIGWERQPWTDLPGSATPARAQTRQHQEQAGHAETRRRLAPREARTRRLLVGCLLERRPRLRRPARRAASQGRCGSGRQLRPGAGLAPPAGPPTPKSPAPPSTAPPCSTTPPPSPPPSPPSPPRCCPSRPTPSAPRPTAPCSPKKSPPPIAPLPEPPRISTGSSHPSG